MPEYTKTDKTRNTTYIVTATRELTETEIDKAIEASVKSDGYPPIGSTRIVNLWTPKSRTQSE